MKITYSMSTNYEYVEKIDVEKYEVSHKSIDYKFGFCPYYDIDTILNEFAANPYKTKTLKYVNNDEDINNELNIRLYYKLKTLELIGLIHDFSIYASGRGTMDDVISWCQLFSEYTIDQIDSLRGKKYTDAINLVTSRVRFN